MFSSLRKVLVICVLLSLTTVGFSQNPTNTPTLTNTPTWTPIPTYTPVRTNTPIPTDTNTPTSTVTQTYTPTNTPTNTYTPSNTPTSTPTRTPIFTATPVSTFTPTPVVTPHYTPRQTSADIGRELWPDNANVMGRFSADMFSFYTEFSNLPDPTLYYSGDIVSTVTGIYRNYDSNRWSEIISKQYFSGEVSDATVENGYGYFVENNLEFILNSLGGGIRSVTESFVIESEGTGIDVIKATTGWLIIHTDPTFDPGRFTVTVGDGNATTFTIVHNLGYQDVYVGIRDTGTGDDISADVVYNSTTTCTVYFYAPPDSNSKEILVISGGAGGGGSGGGGTSDHGSLSGLGDDDHTQYVHISQSRTISGIHTFNPNSPSAPFLLGVNARGQLITGLNAEYWNGYKSISVSGAGNKAVSGTDIVITVYTPIPATPQPTFAYAAPTPQPTFAYVPPTAQPISTPWTVSSGYGISVAVTPNNVVVSAHTPTNTPTPTPTATRTNTPTITPTFTVTPTPTIGHRIQDPNNAISSYVNSLMYGGLGMKIYNGVDGLHLFSDSNINFDTANAIINNGYLSFYPYTFGTKIKLWQDYYSIGVSSYAMNLKTDKRISVSSDTVVQSVTIDADIQSIEAKIGVFDKINFRKAYTYAEVGTQTVSGDMFLVSYNPQTLALGIRPLDGSYEEGYILTRDQAIALINTDASYKFMGIKPPPGYLTQDELYYIPFHATQQ